MTPFLSARGIVKRFPGVLANDHVDFDVNAGEIHALLGENGAGKSTLMQIVYGLYGRDAGEILIEGRPLDLRSTRDAIAAGIGMIHQEFMLVRRFSATENVVLGLKAGGALKPLDLEGPAREIAELSRRYGLQVDPAARIEHLPVGTQQRVEILKLLYRKAKLLILDEPTAVLTPGEAEALLKVLRTLADQGHAVVIVTHKLHEIMAAADRVTIMRDGRVVGSVKTAESSEAELARLMVGREVALTARRSTRPAGPSVLRVEGLTVMSDQGRSALEGLSLDLREGEILGLAGVDGNGQSELAQALTGLRTASGGRVLLGERDLTRASPAERRSAGVAYVPADRRHVGSVGALSIAENAILGDQRAYARFGLLDRKRGRSFAAGLMERFDIRPRKPDYPAGKLSGGNLQKVQLGRAIASDPRALIVEQPTRGLDVGAIEAVWAELLRLREAGKAILLISAELEEILNLSDRIAVIYEGRIMGELPAAQADLRRIGLMMAGSHGEEDGHADL
ncbi:ABC transporter ATP-binding protein [Neomegalonema perideroedes]|uniref:ABC transporter ATP-binding protein n=1 Tax=Neomegalonema perideroedes TaxID=217219 RepID=UPI000378FCB1|nr:ABC transporter ATP-binding protein [Neomegalonema perideroedes]